MSTLTFKIDDADAKLLTDLAKAAVLSPVVDRIDKTTQKISEGADQLIITDRTRAIEQFKRFYAVIAGFAAVTFLNNAILCVRHLEPASGIALGYGILIAQLISFFSLLILFVFGAERLLDMRYLQPNSEVPSWSSLVTDIFSLLITVGWFAVLANLLPVPTVTNPGGDLPRPPPTVKLDDLRDSLRLFFYALCFVYLVDLIFLGVQREKFKKQKPLVLSAPGAPKQLTAQSIHQKWLIINGLTFAGMLIISAHLMTAKDGAYYGLASFGLGAIHLGRFWWDFSATFPFYYPSKALSSPPTAEKQAEATIDNTKKVAAL
jgi:hypothetical protein